MNSNRSFASLIVPLAAFFAVLLFVLAATALITFIMPESFVGTARVHLSDTATGVNSTNHSANAPNFVATECEVIRSEIVLTPVIQNLDLNNVWGRKYGGQRLKTSDSLALLKRTLDVRPVRDTALIEIRVFSERPDEAASIANAVAESYQNLRLQPFREAAIARHAANPQWSIADEYRAPSVIVDRATPGLQPVRPNKPLNLAVGAALGILSGLLVAAGLKFLMKRA